MQKRKFSHHASVDFFQKLKEATIGDTPIGLIDIVES